MAIRSRPTGGGGHETGLPHKRLTVPARWRILGWILFTTAVVLVAVVTTARGLLLTQVGRDANAHVELEIGEYRAFAREGVDPRTARPFDSVERLADVFLSRQKASEDEVFLALVNGHVIRVNGHADLPHDLATDTSLLAPVTQSESNAGVIDLPRGEMRWARVPVDAGVDSGMLVVAIFTAGAITAVENTIQTVALVALAGIGLTAMIGWAAAGAILAPIRQVRSVAAGIGEHDLGVRVPVRGRDDIAALAESFNAMLDRLERAYATQRQFIDDASHELRTPITVIRGELEVMQIDATTHPAERVETLRRVDDELSRMARIVTDLLMLAKADRPDFIQKRVVSVSEMTLDIEAKAQMLGDRNWQMMAIAEGTAEIDCQRITQAVLQLATNAVSHTAPGDVIRLGSEFIGGGADRQLRVWVRDTGPGVCPDDIPGLFERFTRGSRTPGAVPTDRAGAGLGLAIVRAIADTHGGAAWVSSPPGEGATFGIDLLAPELPEPENGGVTGQ